MDIFCLFTLGPNTRQDLARVIDPKYWDGNVRCSQEALCA